MSDSTITEPTWRPDGGPEAIRETWACTPEVLLRFRAHRISGGHQKWPDQTEAFDGDWYVRPDRRQAEAHLIQAYARFRSSVVDPELYDGLCVDDGRCGAAEWRAFGRRITSTSLWSAFYACRIIEMCPAARSIVDIGGGFGHLAEVLARFYPVTLVELPAVLPLAVEYLRSARPDDGIQYQVRLCLPDDDWSGELLVNTMSMQHMTPANLAFYDARMRSDPPRWIYLVNRTTQRDPTDTPIQDYPFLHRYRPVSDRPFLGAWREFFGELLPEFQPTRGGQGDG